MVTDDRDLMSASFTRAVLLQQVACAIYDREGGTVLERSETQHGNDMHGHY